MTPLILAALFGLGPVPGVVDRVEGDWAVVEWSAGDCRDLPAALFEQAPAEGRGVRLWALPHPRGAWRLGPDGLQLGTGAPPLDFSIPAPSGAHAGRRYLVILTLLPPAPAPALAKRVVAAGERSGGLQPTNTRMRP
jgi:hypothetical protein